MLNPIETKIWHILEPGIDDLGFRLVRIMLSGSAPHMQLQVMIEPQEASVTNRVSVTVDDCEKVSRMASVLLDVEDPIDCMYTLEVSSTGIERPLVNVNDFTLYSGSRIKLDLLQALADKKRKFFGIIKDVVGTDIHIEEEQSGETFVIPYTDIRRAHIALSDAQYLELMKNMKDK